MLAANINHKHLKLVRLSFHISNQTLPKAQRTRGLSSSYQSNLLRSYHKFKHKSWSNSSSESWLSINFSAKHQYLQISNKLKIKILTKPSFRISSKIQLHNLYKTSAAKCWTNSSFKILTNPCAQSLNKRLVLCPNVSSQINKLLPTWSSASTSATVKTSTNLSWHLHRQSSLLNRSQSVSQWVTDKHSQWSDSAQNEASNAVFPIYYVINKAG